MSVSFDDKKYELKISYNYIGGNTILMRYNYLENCLEHAMKLAKMLRDCTITVNGTDNRMYASFHAYGPDV